MSQTNEKRCIRKFWLYFPFLAWVWLSSHQSELKLFTKKVRFHIHMGHMIWVRTLPEGEGFVMSVIYRCSRLSESETKDTKQKALKVSNWNRTDLVEKIMFKDQTIEIWAYCKSKESRRIVLAPVISLRNLFCVNLTQSQYLT